MKDNSTKNKWRKAFIGNERGNFAIIMSLAAVPLIMGAGMAIDYTLVTTKHEAVQSALDASILAGFDESGAFNKAKAEDNFFANLEDDPSATVETPEYTQISTGQWQADVKVDLKLTFGGFFIPTSVEIKNRSGATFLPGTSATVAKTPNMGCIHTLSNQSQSFLQNSNAIINAPDCTINVGKNKSNAQTTGFNSGFKLNVEKICVGGVLSYDNRTAAEKASVPVETKCDVPGDFVKPLALYLTTRAAFISTAFSPYSFSNWKTFDYNQSVHANTHPYLQNYNATVTDKSPAIQAVIADNKRVLVLEPGKYPSANFNSGNYTVILKPGLYYIDGTWNINGQDFIGEEVSMFFSDFGKLQPNSGMAPMFSAPKSGDFKGMLFWENPYGFSWNDWNFNDSKSYSYLKGIFYLPKRHVTLNSSAQATYNSTMITRRLTINAASNMTFGEYLIDYLPTNSKFVPPKGVNGGTSKTSASTSSKLRLNY